LTARLRVAACRVPSWAFYFPPTAQMPYPIEYFAHDALDALCPFGKPA
jgi:hypothetical protein